MRVRSCQNATEPGGVQYSSEFSVVVTSPADLAARSAEDPQDGPDEHEHDSGSPQDADMEQEGENEQHDAKRDHGCSAFCYGNTGGVSRPPQLCPQLHVSKRRSVYERGRDIAVISRSTHR